MELGNESPGELTSIEMKPKPNGLYLIELCLLINSEKNIAKTTLQMSSYVYSLSDEIFFFQMILYNRIMFLF